MAGLAGVQAWVARQRESQTLPNRAVLAPWGVGWGQRPHFLDFECSFRAGSGTRVNESRNEPRTLAGLQVPTHGAVYSLVTEAGRATGSWCLLASPQEGRRP